MVPMSYRSYFLPLTVKILSLFPDKKGLKTSSKRESFSISLFTLRKRKKTIQTTTTLTQKREKEKSLQGGGDMSSRAREKREKYGTKRKRGFPKSPGKNSTPAAGRHGGIFKNKLVCFGCRRTGHSLRDCRYHNGGDASEFFLKLLIFSFNLEQE